jgi:peptidoglycan L-alanyl-D-glutamate endopeptidase CwlK
MPYTLGNKSRHKLYGVHPDLVLVVNKAIEITTQDFTVLEGLRTLERQQQLYSTGKSKTMNSRHLTGHAVDLAPWPISWDWEYFYPIAEAMKDASDEVGVPIEWGGDWKSFPDGPHFQLPHKDYPA